MRVRMNIGGVEYALSFRHRGFSVDDLVRDGVLPKRKRKSAKKQEKKEVDPDDVIRQGTECALTSDGKVLAHGISICSPRDNFDRGLGRKHAIERMIMNNRRRRRPGDPFDMTRDFTRQLWQQYLQRV